MYRKTSIIGLLAALLVLVGIFFAVKYTGNKDRTFRSQVLTFDPQLVSGLEVNDFETGEAVEIKKENDGWKLYSGGKEYSGGVDGIANAIGLLSKLNTVSIVATSSEKWEKYKVDKNQAIRVKLFDGNKVLGDIFIGKFDFEQLPPAAQGQQPQTQMTSYVRPADEDNVYAIRGLLRSNFQGGIKPFRNRILFLPDDHLDITGVKISGPSKNMELIQGANGWTFNGIPADSARTDRYLRSLAQLRNHTYIDDVDVSAMKPAYIAEIEGKSFETVKINAYEAADSTIGYYVTSSENWGSVFNGTKSNTFIKVFEMKEKLFPDGEK